MSTPWLTYRRSGLFLTFVAALMLFGCHKKTEQSYSRIRFADFLLPAGSVNINVTGAMDTTFTLSYGEATGYARMPEGKYTIDYMTAGDSLVLHRELGIGKETKYTITISGIAGPGPNARTLRMRLEEAAEGATARSPNAGMPITGVFLDRFEGSKDEGKLKIVHLAPGLTDLDIYLRKKDKFSKLTSLKYPHPSERNYALSPGSYPVEIRYKSSSLALYKGTVEIRPRELTTLYIFGNPGIYPYQLGVRSLFSGRQKSP